MSLFECREKFQASEIDKKTYIDEMYNIHERLFEYTRFIKHTEISSIQIQDDHLIITLRDSGLKLISEHLDKRAAPFEALNFDFYEKQDTQMILTLLQPKMVFFDIGANIGWHTMHVANHDKTIYIHAFEPIPKTFELLKKNIILNRIDNVTLHNLGFADKNQEINFYIDPTTSVSASARNISESSHTHQTKARIERLDDFFEHQGLTQVDFMKCDVEGGELLIYRGGINVLNNYQPIIFTEMLRKWSAKFGYHPNEILQLLMSLGYRCFTAKNDKLSEFFLMDDNTQETNFFFLHNVKHERQIKELESTLK